MPPIFEDAKAVFGKLSGDWGTILILGQWWPQECDIMDMEWATANLLVSLFVGCGLILITKLLMERYFKWKNVTTDDKSNLGWEWLSNKYNGKGE